MNYVTGYGLRKTGEVVRFNIEAGDAHILKCLRKCLDHAVRTGEAEDALLIIRCLYRRSLYIFSTIFVGEPDSKL